MNHVLVKWIGLIAVLALVGLAAYTYRSRQENPYCQTKANVEQGPSCQEYKYWWDR